MSQHLSRMVARSITFGLLLMVGPREPCAEPRWPRFRGADGNGHTADTDLRTKWGPDDVAWRTEIEGRGHSSPCVWDGKIYLTSALTKDDGQVERRVSCLTVDGGKLLWQQTASVGEAEVNHGMNSFASSTCATDGKHVVAFFGRGGIHCYDTQGKKLWSHDLGEFPGPWGTAASPVIVGHTVIQNCDAQGKSFLLAYDLATGRTVWETARPDMPRGGWSTPIMVDVGSRRELVLNGEQGVTGYDPDTGKELWFCRGSIGRGTPSPVFGRGLVFVITGKPGDTYAVRAGGHGDVTESRRAWHTPRGKGRNLASPILVQNYLLTVAMEGNAFCYDSETGRELWTGNLGARCTGSPIAANGLVYFVLESGETLVVKPGDKLDIVATNAVGPAKGETFRACPVPCEGQLLIRSDVALYCIGPESTSKP